MRRSILFRLPRNRGTGVAPAYRLLLPLRFRAADGGRRYALPLFFRSGNRLIAERQPAFTGRREAAQSGDRVPASLLERQPHLEDEAIDGPGSFQVAHAPLCDQQPAQHAVVPAHEFRENHLIPLLSADESTQLGYDQTTVRLQVLRNDPIHFEAQKISDKITLFPEKKPKTRGFISK